MIPKLALRNLFRNRWRTFLTMGGIAVATTMLIWTSSFTEGFIQQMVRGATAVKTGQILVHDPDYAEQPSLFEHFDAPPALLDAIQNVDGVKGAAPRVYAFGLVGTEQRSQAAQLMGVQPEREARTTLLADALTEGRWLSPTPPEYPEPREAVIGAHLAKQLGVGMGDVDGDGEPDNEVVSFIQAADGSLGNDLFRIVGVVRSGNTEVDRMALIVHIDDLRYSAALDGRAHEIAVIAHDLGEIDALTEEVRGVVDAAAPPDAALLTRSWKEVMSQLYQMLEMSSSSIAILYIIIFAIAGLGILNTQRMSALERKREFGVLLALGLKPRQLAGMIVLEAAILTVIGGLIGAALGAAITGYYSVVGFDMAGMSDTASGSDFTYMGVAFSEPIPFVFDLGLLLTPVFIVTLMGSLFGLWPAIKSARINAIQAISGRA